VLLTLTASMQTSILLRSRVITNTPTTTKTMTLRTSSSTTRRLVVTRDSHSLDVVNELALLGQVAVAIITGATATTDNGTIIEAVAVEGGTREMAGMAIDVS